MFFSLDVIQIIELKLTAEEEKFQERIKNKIIKTGGRRAVNQFDLI